MDPKQKLKKFSRLNILAFVISLAALTATIWIVVPAPSYYVWLFSVLASEWSLGFGCLALIGIFCALLSRRKNASWFWLISFLLGASALIISLYPLFSAYQISRQQSVSLSFSEYISGFGRGNSQFNFSTRVFASVDGNDLMVDIYSPPDGVEKKNVGIIVVHGGSWSGGVRNDFPQWNRWLSENGYTIFDIDYRLKQPNWQTATGDVKCSISWVQQNAKEFNISPDKIALMGRSAGGHLALLAAFSTGQSQLPSNCQNNNRRKIRAVISLYGPTDLIWDFDNPANQRVIDGPGTLKRLMGGSPYDSDEMRNNFSIASPLNYITADTPPTLIIHGGNDQLVLPQNMYFLAAKLKENNVINQEVFIGYGQHGFDYNFNGWGSQIIKPKILEFLSENTK